MKLDHVGIAVESLAQALPIFEKLLGRVADSKEDVDDQQVRVAVFKLGESRLELLEATSADSPVGRFVSKRGPGIHHLTLAVEDLLAALREPLSIIGDVGLRLDHGSCGRLGYPAQTVRLR